MGQHDEGQQGRESPRGKSSSDRVSERTSKKHRKPPRGRLLMKA